MTTPSITVLLDKLQERGLLLRERSKTDGRGMSLSLTKQGLALVSLALKQLLAGDDELLENLSAGERIILTELLHKIWQSAK